MCNKTIDIDVCAKDYKNKLDGVKKRIIICAGTGCVANGSLAVRDAILEELARHNLNVNTDLEKEELKENSHYVSKSGCQGFCQMGPLLRIEPDGILYTKVKASDAAEIVSETILGGNVIERLLYQSPLDGKHYRGDHEIPFYKRQHRIVLANCTIEPASISEYIAKRGYEAARKAFTQMTPEEVCKVLEDSGLRGRGGGGFPTGRKWRLTLASKNDVKYVICNGDEGDPGAFMDRSVMEGNPHTVIEGMMIAARAIEATEGYVYVRAEYPLAVERMLAAVKDAERVGILGENIFGSGRSFRIHIMEGAGAFVCGEETALIASIEGKRGMPMPKPPFPAQRGLWGKPTVINNVETLATVAYIVREGAAKFRELGTPTSPGTKTFALTGHVANTGLIEVPFGTTLGEIVNEIGGGVTDDHGRISPDNFKAVQIGGPSGGCLTKDMINLPLDFDSLKSVGAMVGSGGLVVMNQQTCMPAVAKFFMRFTQNESCGKCVPCREGTKQMLALLDDITKGKADENTLALLEETAKAVQMGSLCGLGKTAPNPILSTLRHFREEYETHVRNKRCPAGQCKALAVPEILADKCRGCTVCAKKCPVGAISGTLKKPHKIDVDKCIRCGACKTACKFGAVTGL